MKNKVLAVNVNSPCHKVAHFLLLSDATGLNTERKMLGCWFLIP